MSDADMLWVKGNAYVPYAAHERLMIDKDQQITTLRARVAELEEALRPLACTCAAKHQVECSRSEKDCPFWAARAAITKTGESNE